MRNSLKLSTITFLVPTYNDEATIAAVIEQCIHTGKQIAKKFSVLVINDGSTDHTPHILDELANTYPNVILLTHQRNAGYGPTIKELYIKAGNDWMFTVPGDNQIPPQEISKLIPLTTSYDIIIGKREQRNDNLLRYAQSKIYNTLLRYLYGIQISDINSTRLMRRTVIQALSIQSDSPFVDAELVIKAIRDGFKTIEVPIIHKRRATTGATGGNIRRTILPTIRDMVHFYPTLHHSSINT